MRRNRTENERGSIGTELAIKVMLIAVVAIQGVSVFGQATRAHLLCASGDIFGAFDAAGGTEKAFPDVTCPKPAPDPSLS